LKILSLRIGWALIFLYSGLHLYIILRNATDVPYLDEWELFKSDGIIQGWSFDFIFSFFLDHRIVLTKVIYLLNYDLFGLNFRYQILLSVLCHAGLAVTVWKTIGKEIGEGKSFFALLAFLPFVSNLPFESHTRALLVGKVLILWSLLGGAYFLVKKEGSRCFMLGAFLWGIAFLGGSSGVAGVIASCGALVLWNLVVRNKKGLFKSFSLFFLFSLGLYFWSRGYQRDPVHPAFTLPWEAKFFRFLSENVSLGFGFTDLNPYLAFLCLYVLVLAVLAGTFYLRKETDPDSQAGFLLILTTGLLGMTALVAVGRGGMSLWQAKFSRYAEVSIFFPILSVALFGLYPKFKWGSLWLVLLLAVGLRDNFDLSIYRTIGEARKEGRNCVRNLLLRPGTNPAGI